MRYVALLVLSNLLFPLLLIAQSPDSWNQVKKLKKGRLIAYWYESQPFIFQDANGQMQGIEYELLESFRKYLLKEKGVELEIIWKEADSFSNTFTRISQEAQEGTLGISAFSITPERQQEVDFTHPFMSDISVLISSKNVPVVASAEEFIQVFRNMKAITIHGTTYKKALQEIQESLHLPFTIHEIPSSQNILRSIQNTDSAFGYIDLPIYLMEFYRNSGLEVKRQNFFPKRRVGYAFILPKGSTWKAPLDEFFTSTTFKKELEPIIGKHLDLEVFHFIESLYMHSYDEVALLNKEKEIQQREILGKKAQLQKEVSFNYFLMGAGLIVLVSLGIIYYMYTKRSKALRMISLQKARIETQQISIGRQNEELAQQNRRLLEINNEKNNLIRVVAHDLRTPINQMNGFAQILLLDDPTLSPEASAMVRQIIDASLRLNTMISKILDVDAIESERHNIIMEEVDISQFCPLVLQNFQKQATEKNIALHCKAHAHPLKVSADKQYLTGIFENLISNAIKFSPSNRHIWMDIYQEENHACIRLTDEGPGFSKQDHQLLFKKFQRLSAQPTQGEHSTGLGLSIVKKYVELMQGSIRCESELGQGASFVVEIPLKE